MSVESQWLWQGRDSDGVDSRIARAQSHTHVANRPEIAPALELTVRAMLAPDTIEPDRQKPDEAHRHFRLLTVSADGLRIGYMLRVSVKYVQQESGHWIKFFQSAWLERKR